MLPAFYLIFINNSDLLAKLRTPVNQRAVDLSAGPFNRVTLV
jgi:hypothetical protein